jgi:ribonuclease HII
VNPLLRYEIPLWNQGYVHIAGVDEVGRGCLFGDVVAAAVILPQGLKMEGIQDSKKLSASKREQLFVEIQQHALAIGIGISSVDLIEEINIKQASRLAMKQAVDQLSITPDFILIDAEQLDMALPQMSLIHGDRLSQSIAAASIIAKVTRDHMCVEWDRQYPEYGIATHKGYATQDHRKHILTYGETKMHRKLFLRNLLAKKTE